MTDFWNPRTDLHVWSPGTTFEVDGVYHVVPSVDCGCTQALCSLDLRSAEVGHRGFDYCSLPNDLGTAPPSGWCLACVAALQAEAPPQMQAAALPGGPAPWRAP